MFLAQGNTLAASPGIKPGTLRLSGRCPDHLATTAVIIAEQSEKDPFFIVKV